MKAVFKVLIPFLFLIAIVFAGRFALAQIEQESKKNIHDSLRTVLQTTHATLKLWQKNRLDELIKMASNPDLIESVSMLISRYQSDPEQYLQSSALRDFRFLMLTLIE